MSLPVPNLDDRTFDQLVLEGRSLIPRYSQEWTNHNPSDPGITLLELFAWMTETALFQLNQVPDTSIERFLRLLDVCRQYIVLFQEGERVRLGQAPNATEVTIQSISVNTLIVDPFRSPVSYSVGTIVASTTRPARSVLTSALKENQLVNQLIVRGLTPNTDAEPEAIDTTLQRALNALDTVTRTVTADDFETLAKSLASAVAQQTGTAIARAEFVAYTDPLCQPAVPAALVIVVPDRPQNPKPVPSQELTDKIFKELRQHCLLTTRLHVVGPQYIDIDVETTIARKAGSGITSAELEQSIRTFLDPLRGGFDGTGWKFGRSVYYSEMYQWLETLSNVDRVESLAISQSGQPAATGEGVDIPAQALVSAAAVKVTIIG